MRKHFLGSASPLPLHSAEQAAEHNDSPPLSSSKPSAKLQEARKMSTVHITWEMPFRHTAQPPPEWEVRSESCQGIWSSGMIPASGAGGPEFNSRNTPLSFGVYSSHHQATHFDTRYLVLKGQFKYFKYPREKIISSLLS